MKKRTLMWGGVGSVFLLAIIFLYGVFGTHTLTITEKQLRHYVTAMIGKEFPMKGVAGIAVKTVSVKNADVSIKDGKLLVTVDAEGTLRTNKKFHFSSYTVGVPTYQSGEFFFKPEKVMVKNFAYDGSSPSETIEAFNKRYITNEKLKILAEDGAPKVEGWVTTAAQEAVGHTLSRRPVYILKNDVKGYVIGAALQSVEIGKDEIKIVFSLWQLTLSVLFGFLILIASVALAFTMIKNPRLGLASIALS